MGYNFKEVMNKPERFAPGHRMCAGCGATICARNVLRGLHEGDKAVIGCATENQDRCFIRLRSKILMQ